MVVGLAKVVHRACCRLFQVVATSIGWSCDASVWLSSVQVVDELLPLVRLEVVGLFPNWNRNKAALWLKLPVVN